MPTISLCMIVKNEETVLARCLDSIADLMDEIIIVDTGSTDRTKEIAALYTSQVYDFPWQDDFSAARNFSFSKASMDYIYAPDADEVLDAVNRNRFRTLKENLLPEIEIVQMLYHTVSEFNTVLNVQKEYRPKLFKRLRTFRWVDPIHETICTSPIVYDSDIEILHMPVDFHHKRDFSVFLKAYQRDGVLSPKILHMYAKELLKLGDETDLQNAMPVFLAVIDHTQDEDLRKAISCALARSYRLQNDTDNFFKLALKDMITTPCSELCYELGCYFMEKHDYEEAVLWFYNAAFETSAILDIHTNGDLPLYALTDCYEALALQIQNTVSGNETGTPSQIENESDCDLIAEYHRQAKEYRRQAEKWELPEE